MIILGLAHLQQLKRGFESGVCRYLGRVSFMLYLTHRMIGSILGPSVRLFILKLLGVKAPSLFVRPLFSHSWILLTFSKPLHHHLKHNFMK